MALGIFKPYDKLAHKKTQYNYILICIYTTNKQKTILNTSFSTANIYLKYRLLT